MVFAPADPVTRSRHVTHAATPSRTRVNLPVLPRRLLPSIIDLGSLLIVPMA
jgi:hypothetical protein